MNWFAHRRVKREVSAFVDGQLDAASAEAVAAHLRDCWRCSGDVELMWMIKCSLRNLAARRGDAVTLLRLRRFANGLKH